MTQIARGTRWCFVDGNEDTRLLPKDSTVSVLRYAQLIIPPVCSAISAWNVLALIRSMICQGCLLSPFLIGFCLIKMVVFFQLFALSLSQFLDLLNWTQSAYLFASCIPSVLVSLEAFRLCASFLLSIIILREILVLINGHESNSLNPIKLEGNKFIRPLFCLLKRLLLGFPSELPNQNLFTLIWRPLCSTIFAILMSSMITMPRIVTFQIFSTTNGFYWCVEKDRLPVTYERAIATIEFIFPSITSILLLLMLSWKILKTTPTSNLTALFIRDSKIVAFLALTDLVTGLPFHTQQTLQRLLWISDADTISWVFYETALLVGDFLTQLLILMKTLFPQKINPGDPEDMQYTDQTETVHYALDSRSHEPKEDRRPLYVRSSSPTEPSPENYTATNSGAATYPFTSLSSSAIVFVPPAAHLACFYCDHHSSANDHQAFFPPWPLSTDEYLDAQGVLVSQLWGIGVYQEWIQYKRMLMEVNCRPALL